MIDFDLPSVMDIGGPELVIDQSGIFISNVLSGIINEHVLTILSQVDTCDLRHFVSVFHSLSYQLNTVGNSHLFHELSMDVLKGNLSVNGGGLPNRQTFLAKTFVLLSFLYQLEWKSDCQEVRLLGLN